MKLITKCALAAFLFSAVACSPAIVETKPSLPPDDPAEVVDDQPKASESTTVVAWRSSVEQALLESMATGRPVFIYFYSESCGWCAEMNKEFDNRALVGLLNMLTVPVKENVAKSEVAQQAGINVVPTVSLAYVSPEGAEIVFHIPGFKTAHELLGELNKGVKR